MEENETNDKQAFQRQVSKKESRKLKAKQGDKQSALQGFGVFGLIGWSVAVPTVLLTLLGLWLDEQIAGERSYTLALLLAGLMLGCLNAWYWVSRKMEEIKEQDQEEPSKTTEDE